jgi:hypothetical protein
MRYISKIENRYRRNNVAHTSVDTFGESTEGKEIIIKESTYIKRIGAVGM